MPLVIQAVSIAMWLNRRLAVIEVVVASVNRRALTPNRHLRLTPQRCT